MLVGADAFIGPFPPQRKGLLYQEGAVCALRRLGEKSPPQRKSLPCVKGGVSEADGGIVAHLWSLSPQSGLAASHLPYPLCRFATSPLDKGSRPPGGRLKKSRHQNPHAQKGKQPGRAEAAGLLIHEAGWDWSGILGSSSGMSSPEITSSISSSLSTSSWGKRSFTRSRTVVR